MSLHTIVRTAVFLAMSVALPVALASPRIYPTGVTIYDPSASVHWMAGRIWWTWMATRSASGHMPACRAT
jgi:hypothetical protein